MQKKPGLVAHTYIPITWMDEAGVWCQPVRQQESDSKSKPQWEQEEAVTTDYTLIGFYVENTHIMWEVCYMN